MLHVCVRWRAKGMMPKTLYLTGRACGQYFGRMFDDGCRIQRSRSGTSKVVMIAVNTSAEKRLARIGWSPFATLKTPAFNAMLATTSSTASRPLHPTQTARAWRLLSVAGDFLRRHFNARIEQQKENTNFAGDGNRWSVGQVQKDREIF